MSNVNWKDTFKLWVFTAFNIPLIFYLRPRVLELNDERSIMEIKLGRRSKNHLRSMYFGALCTGADLAPGLIAMRLIGKQKQKLSFLFKDFDAHFLKRCEGNVRFTCLEGDKISKAIQLAIQSKERQNIPIAVVATVPSLAGDEPHATFTLTLSIRAKS